MPDAVVFDLDGVLLDSEQRWNDAKEAVTTEAGGRWRDDAATAMMGMSSPEWSAYMHDELAVPCEPERINELVVERMAAGYAEELPLLPGAIDAVETLAARWPLGLASSSNREIIDAFLDLSGLRDRFRRDDLLRGGRARQALARRLPARSPRGSAPTPLAASPSRTPRTACGRRLRPGWP